MKLESWWGFRHGFPCTLMVVSCLAGAPFMRAADRKPFFVDPVVRLSPNSARDFVMVKIKVEGLTTQELESTKEPKLVDESNPAPIGGVTFQFVRSDSPGKAARVWYFTASIDGLPASQTQKRVARFQVDSINDAAEYTLSNQATAASNWTVLPLPDPWVLTNWWPRTQCVPVGLTTGDAPATSLTIRQAVLIEQSTKKLLGSDHLKLCPDPEGAQCGNGTFDLAPHYAGPPLYFCVDEGFRGHGNYRGTVNLSALEKPETQAVSLNIYSSSFGAKVFGFLLILGGVVAAWVTKIFASNRLTRDQELLPVTLLRRRVEELQSDLADLPAVFQPGTPGIGQDITLLLQALTPANLEAQHFIHPATPSPFSTPVDSAGLKSFLADRDTRVNLLTVLVEEGVKPAVQMATRQGARPTDNDVLAALARIDALRSQNPLPSEAQARATITQQILPNLAGTITALAGAAQPTAALARPVSFDRLQVEITSLNLLVWGAAGLLSALVGLIVLILNNPGFGNAVDYIYCVFWGFGIPTAVQQLTSNSAVSALGISVSKS
jgi:hypothetical protein